MLTLPDALEQLTLALPRIGGTLDAYAFTLALVYDREIYPNVVAAVSPIVREQPTRSGALLNFANTMSAVQRRSLLIRTIAEMQEDAHGLLLRFGFDPAHAHYWTTEAMTSDQRSMVLRSWDARGESAVWTALRAALCQMAERYSAVGGSPPNARYVAEQVVLTRTCDLGHEGEHAIVSTIDGATMVLYFPDRPLHASKVTTDVDYKYIRSEVK
jgi:hypothetical protein